MTTYVSLKITEFDSKFKVAPKLHPIIKCSYRGGGSNSKVGVQIHLEAKKVGAQNLHFLYLRLKKWVYKCAPLRIRLHRP